MSQTLSLVDKLCRGAAPMVLRTESLDGPREERWGSQFFLGNGRMGLRGHHEDITNAPAAGFYVAGTYTYAPPQLVPLHLPEHILVHPDRLAAYKDGTKDPDLYTLPNLPNPFTVKIMLDGEPADPGKQPLLACERALYMEEARLSRRLVFLDTKQRRCIADSERWVSWHDRRLLGWRYELQCDDPSAEITVTPCFDTNVTNVRGIRLFSILSEEQQDNACQITCSIPGLASPNDCRARMVNDLRAAINPREHINPETQAPPTYLAGRSKDHSSPTITSAAVSRHDATIRMAMVWHTTRAAGKVIVETIVVVSLPDDDDPLQTAQAAMGRGYKTIRHEHLKAVTDALREHTLEIGSDPLTAEGLRHGQLHLEMALCPDNPNVSIPIKGLTGEGYRFMVFWDTDFHMFPYYLYTRPEQARNLLLYRYNLLDAARHNASHWGYRGAQIPWETGTSGKEETAPWLNLQDRELHISADTAYAVMLYDRATDDPVFLEQCGAEIVFETARFYASRTTWNEDKKRFEILDIGCPDQYHTWADNNVFISRMARWNIQYAVQLASNPRTSAARTRIGLTEDEIANLRCVAENLHVIGPDKNGLIEEFDGYFNLSPDLRGITEKFCSHSLAVKQPDVVAAFHLFPDDYPQEILQKNWRYYAECTLHGSSLSLPGMALAAAVAGLIPESVPFFQKGSRLDLDDVNGNTGIGIHVSAYAVLWETAVFGYLGCRFMEDGIWLAPGIPQGWSFIEAPICWQGQRLRIRTDHKGTTIAASPDNKRTIPVGLIGHAFLELQPGKEIQL